MKLLRRLTWTTLFVVLAPCLAPCVAFAADDPRTDGPLGLITTVRVAPADRAAFRKALVAKALPQLERLKRQGRLAEYHLLFSRYADSETFDAMLQLGFARPADIARWREVESTSPGGLPAGVLPLVKAMATVPVDRMREGRAAGLSARPTWLVIPYDYFVSTNDYLKYIDGYLVPQVDGWVSEGIVSRYGIWFGRYAAGRPWSSLFVIEYVDDAALGQRDATVAKVRARLRDNPEWRAISDGKDKVRVERAPVIADELMP